MLQDDDRNQAYNKAIRLLATNKSVDDIKTPLRWLDIGTGSGLLASLVAAASSPSKLSTEVYACEGVKEVADVADKTFEINGLGVRLFRGRSTEMEIGRDLPSRAPRVISELLGTGLLEEGVIPTMRDAKTRLLEPGFVSIPSSAQVWAFCCESLELARMSRLSASTTASFRAPSSENWQNCPGSAAPASMHVRLPESGGVRFRPLSSSVRIFDFDFADLPGPDGRKCGSRFPIDAKGTIHAVVCWWRCFMDEDQTIVMSTSPEAAGYLAPRRDHWRQSVYLLNNPVSVDAGDTALMAACHDDSMIWFGAVECLKKPPDYNHEVVGFESTPQGSSTADRERMRAATPGESSTVVRSTAEGEESAGNGQAEASETLASSVPPVCLCGLHRTCPPSRIWMLNDEGRTSIFRSAIRSILETHRRADDGRDRSTAQMKRRTVYACISDGFLLPLLAAQEGASDVLEIPSSSTSGAVCRDVYRANGIHPGNVRAFPGGISNFYELLSPPPGSTDVSTRVGKLDAVIGEPFFADISSAWPLESLLLFWCVRTALEASGCFSPRTRVVPARACILACPFSCDLLFRGRRRVGTVEGVAMSAVNDALGCNRGLWAGEGAVAGEGEGLEGRQPGDVESVRLQDYPHVLLGPPTAVLDMDITKPLCDLLGGRTRMRCVFAENLAHDREEAGVVMCHGVALWLDVWLDEEGRGRLSTGPDVPYWPQGLLFFEEEWSVTPCGRSFHLEAILEDGALRLDVS